MVISISNIKSETLECKYELDYKNTFRNCMRWQTNNNRAIHIHIECLRKRKHSISASKVIVSTCTVNLSLRIRLSK